MAGMLFLYLVVRVRVVMAKGTFLSFPSLSVLPGSKSYALHLSSNSSTAENASFTNNANKDNSASEPRRTYPAIVILSKFPTRKDRVKDQDLLKDSQCERERGDKDKDRSKEKDKDRKKTSYPSVGFRVRPGKEPSLARVRTTSVGAPTTTTTQGDFWSIDDDVEPADPSVRSADANV